MKRKDDVGQTKSRPIWSNALKYLKGLGSSEQVEGLAADRKMDSSPLVTVERQHIGPRCWWAGGGVGGNLWQFSL